MGDVAGSGNKTLGTRFRVPLDGPANIRDMLYGNCVRRVWKSMVEGESVDLRYMYI